MALFRLRPLPVRPSVLTLARRVVRARFAWPTTARNRCVLPTAQAPAWGMSRNARGDAVWRIVCGTSIDGGKKPWLINDFGGDGAAAAVIRPAAAPRREWAAHAAGRSRAPVFSVRAFVPGAHDEGARVVPPAACATAGVKQQRCTSRHRLVTFAEEEAACRPRPALAPRGMAGVGERAHAATSGVQVGQCDRTRARFGTSIIGLACHES